MDDVDFDLKETKEFLSGNIHKKYGRIYPTTNEDLGSLFNCFSVKDKNVFTVLASSDQLFCAYYNGAKSVETFDKNKLAKHYYYLRKWLLKYRGVFYPNACDVSSDIKWIADLLSLVKCDNYDEEYSYKYWHSYVNEVTGGYRKDIFHRCEDINLTGINDISLLLQLIEDKELVFKCQDMDKEIDKSRKYNTIIMSNVLEYTSFSKEDFVRSRDNLYDILEDDGEVICSNVLGGYPYELQQEVFLEKFDYELYDGKDSLRDDRAVGYCYRKK